MRMARFLFMYRQCNIYAMQLKFCGISPGKKHYRQVVELPDLVSITDYTPDSFDSPMARRIRAMVPQ